MSLRLVPFNVRSGAQNVYLSEAGAGGYRPLLSVHALERNISIIAICYRARLLYPAGYDAASINTSHILQARTADEQSRITGPLVVQLEGSR